MKRIGVLFLVFFCYTLQAQEFKYGVTGNGHKSSITGVHDRSKGKWGGGAGFFVQWPLVENDVYDSAWLYFTPSVEYNMMGELADADPARYAKQKYEMDYVSLRTYIKYFFHKGNMKRDVFLFGGPFAQYLVRQSKDVPAAYDAAYFKYNHDDKVNNFGLGLSVGIGLKVNDYWEGTLRYDRSLMKVYPNNTAKNTATQMLALGVNYYIGRE